MGKVDKTYGGGEFASLYATDKSGLLTLTISRDKVCKKIITFDCEPLFSGEELEAL